VGATALLAEGTDLLLPVGTSPRLLVAGPRGIEVIDPIEGKALGTIPTALPVSRVVHSTKLSHTIYGAATAAGQGGRAVVIDTDALTEIAETPVTFSLGSVGLDLSTQVAIGQSSELGGVLSVDLVTQTAGLLDFADVQHMVSASLKVFGNLTDIEAVSSNNTLVATAGAFEDGTIAVWTNDKPFAKFPGRAFSNLIPAGDGFVLFKDGFARLFDLACPTGTETGCDVPFTDGVLLPLDGLVPAACAGQAMSKARTRVALPSTSPFQATNSLPPPGAGKAVDLMPAPQGAEGLEVTGLSASSTRQGSYPGSLLVTVDGHLTHFASFTSSDSVAVAPDGSALYVAVEGKVYAVEAPSGLKSALRLLWDAGSGLPIGPLLVSPDGANLLAVEKNDNHPMTLFR
jgi:hypothetical protein